MFDRLAIMSRTQTPRSPAPRRLTGSDDEESPLDRQTPASFRQQPPGKNGATDVKDKEEKEKEPLQETINQPKSATSPSQEDNTNRISVQLLKGLAIYLTLIPVILVVALREVYFREGLLTGLALSGTLSLVHTAFWWFKWKREVPYIQDVALLLFFVIFVALNETHPYDFGPYLLLYQNVTIFGWLSLVTLISLAVRYPWTLQHAKEVAPEISWTSRTFRTVVDQVAGAWALSYALVCLLCVVPVQTNSWSKDPLNIVFNYVFPYLMMVTCLVLTRWWPRFIRVKVYIPRMNGGVVKPEGEGAEVKDSLTAEQQKEGIDQQQQQTPGQINGPELQTGLQQQPSQVVPGSQQQQQGQSQQSGFPPYQQQGGYSPMQSGGSSTTPPQYSHGSMGPGYPQSGPGYPLSGPGYPYPQSGPGYPQSGPGYPQSGPGYPQSGYSQSQYQTPRR